MNNTRRSYLERLISILARVQRLYVADRSPDFEVLSRAMHEAREEHERLAHEAPPTPPGDSGSPP